MFQYHKSFSSQKKSEVPLTAPLVPISTPLACLATPDIKKPPPSHPVTTSSFLHYISSSMSASKPCGVSSPLKSAKQVSKALAFSNDMFDV